jgi:predicted RNase H-like HicB family nuclease
LLNGRLDGYDLTMTYKVLLKESEEGFAVWCPGLPGCVSQGDTEEEALENIRTAIAEYLAVRDEIARDDDAKLVEIEA